MTCGIYEIASPSGKRYIGSSIDMDARHNSHFSMLRQGKHHSRALQAAWNKYGTALYFRPLIVCSPSLRFWYEQRAIDGLRPQYNCHPKATGGGIPGHVVSMETRAKLSARHSGKLFGGAISKPWLGKTLAPEHVEKLSEAKRGKPGPRLGAEVTAEAREKISLKLKGRVRTVESRLKQSETLMAGKPKKTPCRGCGAEIRKGAKVTTRFCSRACANRMITKVRKPRARKPRGQCQACGVGLRKEVKAKIRYCSRACSNKTRKARMQRSTDYEVQT